MIPHPPSDQIDFAEFLLALSQHEWKVIKRERSKPLQIAALQARYSRIPDDFLSFLKQIKECVNPSDTAWFLSEDDYNGKAETDFRWNAWELLSLDACQGYPEEAEKVTSFWNDYLPIMMSVRSEYAYISLSVRQETFGQVFYGYETAFEEPAYLCGTFSDLTRLLLQAIQEGDTLEEGNAFHELKDYILPPMSG